MGSWTGSLGNMCLALIDAQLGMGLSGGNKRHFHPATHRFAVLQTVGDESQRQRRHGSGQLIQHHCGDHIRV